MLLLLFYDEFRFPDINKDLPDTAHISIPHFITTTAKHVRDTVETQYQFSNK